MIHLDTPPPVLCHLPPSVLPTKFAKIRESRVWTKVLDGGNKRKTGGGQHHRQALHTIIAYPTIRRFIISFAYRNFTPIHSQRHTLNRCWQQPIYESQPLRQSPYRREHHEHTGLSGHQSCPAPVTTAAAAAATAATTTATAATAAATTTADS